MSDEKVRGLCQTLLASGKYRYYDVTYELKQAKGWRPHERNLFSRPDAATLLPYDAGRQCVLLTRQFRLGAYMNDKTQGLLEACAGTIDPGESAEACMRREAMEEMGLRVDAMDFLFEGFVSPAATTEKLHFFVAPYSPEARVADGGGMEEEGEEIEIVELPFADVLREAKAGAIRDVKTLTLLYWLEASGRMQG